MVYYHNDNNVMWQSGQEMSSLADLLQLFLIGTYQIVHKGHVLL